MGEMFDEAAVRGVIREVLREVLPSVLGDLTGTTSGTSGEVVVIEDDADLRTFVQDIARRCASAPVREHLSETGGAFTLAGAQGDINQVGNERRHDDAIHLERGAVTERIVLSASAEGRSLVLGSAAVLTPLAADRARLLGVSIEREPRGETDR